MNTMKMERSKAHKTATIALATFIVVASLGGGLFVTDEDERFSEDSEAIAPIVAFMIGMIVGAVTYVAVQELSNKTPDQGGVDDYTLQIESDKVAESILIGLSYYRNALNNYANIWKFTNEHFIRTAEIVAASVWGEDKEYDPSKILEESGVYLNSSYMMLNAAAQVSEHFHNVGERLDLWNTDTIYADKMTVSWNYGTNSIGSKSDFDGWLTTATNTITETSNKVFIAGGDFWVFGGNGATITSGSTVLNLPAGHTNLDNVSTFEPGVYDLQSGREYAGNILYVIDTKAADITSAIVMKAGATTKLAKLYNNSKIVIDGSQYDNLDIVVTPDSGTPAPAPIHSSSSLATSGLVKYMDMHRAVNHTVLAANSAANTVWNIYDSAKSVSVYLTTLSVPNYYENVELVQTQQELITRTMMVQFADWVKTHETEIEAGDFNLSGGSMSLLCRGNILDRNGQLLHENVIFTPLFYVKDMTLRTGSNDLTQPAIVAIWDTGPTLSTWDFMSNSEKSLNIGMVSGESIYIYEMTYGGDFVDSLNLDVKQIDIIDAEELPIYVPPQFDADRDLVKLIAMLLMAFGAICALTFPLHKRGTLTIGGVVCIALGALLYMWRNSFLGGLL